MEQMEICELMIVEEVRVLVPLEYGFVYSAAEGPADLNSTPIQYEPVTARRSQTIRHTAKS